MSTPGNNSVDGISNSTHDSQNGNQVKLISHIISSASYSASNTVTAAVEQKQNQQEFIDTSAESGTGTSSNKRRAQLGQWRTPPQPCFPSTSSTTQGQTDNEFKIKQDPSALNNNMEMDPSDFAALQNAYRRGAEAAAALVSQGFSSHEAAQQVLFAAGFAAGRQQTPQTTHMMNATSCPNLQDLSTSIQGIQQPRQPSKISISQGFTQVSHQPQVAHQQQVLGSYGSTNSQSASQQISQPQTSTTLQNPQHVQNQTITSSSNNSYQSQQIQSLQHDTGSYFNQNQQETQQQTESLSSQDATQDAMARSMSLPDISRYAARASAEEEKRMKRLARNRASARLRRQKKKNLVSNLSINGSHHEGSNTQ